MAAYPGSTTPDMGKRSYEKDYGEGFLELEKTELLSLMSAGEARFVIIVATLGGDVLKSGISKSALMCRMNKGIYDDETEDFIARQRAVGMLTEMVQKGGRHEDGERVRLLRSARACLMLSGLADTDPSIVEEDEWETMHTNDEDTTKQVDLEE